MDRTEHTSGSRDTSLWDTCERIKNSWIQHGKSNNRVYLMKLATEDLLDIIPRIELLARERGYTKIISKVPESALSQFLEAGHKEEARIPGFYQGQEAAVFLARYLLPDRAMLSEYDHARAGVALARAQQSQGAAREKLPDRFKVELVRPEAVEEMAEVYRSVFKTYPFPIHEPDFLHQTMQSHVEYYCVRDQGRMVALSSAERDVMAMSVEMTDFATLPAYRGLGFASRLLQEMDGALTERHYRTAFTLARAYSPGMNIAFARAGYTFAGLLPNNTNISGTIQSMNVWYKTLWDSSDMSGGNGCGTLG